MSKISASLLLRFMLWSCLAVLPLAPLLILLGAGHLDLKNFIF